MRRIVYQLSIGELPNDMFVFTICLNHRCVRHSHLFKGTQADWETKCANSKARGDENGSRLHPDRLARGDENGSRTHPERLARGGKHGSRTHPDRVPRGDRHGARIHPERLARGESVHGAKLTANDVCTIRQCYTGERGQLLALARHYNVHPTLIGLIVRRKIWKHVE